MLVINVQCQIPVSLKRQSNLDQEDKHTPQKHTSTHQQHFTNNLESLRTHHDFREKQYHLIGNEHATSNQKELCGLLNVDIEPVKRIQFFDQKLESRWLLARD